MSTLKGDVEKYPELMGPEDFERLTGIDRKSQAVQRCNGRLGLRYFKLGARVRYHRGDVLAWLEARAVAAGHA